MRKQTFSKELTEEIIRLYQEGKSTCDIAMSEGLPKSRVRKILMDGGLKLRSREESIRMVRSRIADKLRGRKRHFSKDHRLALSKARKGSGKGFSKKTNGYVEITRGPNKGRGIHVIIMEGILGRCLKPDEVVHHIDENKQNNDPDNLQLMTRSEHTSHHRNTKD